MKLTPLAALAVRKKVAISFVMHVKAGKTEVEAASVSGVIGFVNVARHALVVGQAGEDLVVGVMKSELTEKWRGYLFHLDYPAGVLLDSDGVDLTPSHLRILGPASPGQVRAAWRRVEDMFDGTAAILESICNAIADSTTTGEEATRKSISLRSRRSGMSRRSVSTPSSRTA